ncbi:unnamed protein product [Rotaria socialis]|uniref:Uncharacterized protein n=1 Tax=Rotaria socialis TaxID=392032 RepID=A0A821TRI0_9BILA|nr:unnamed protein product [Rotaria socialis]
MKFMNEKKSVNFVTLAGLYSPLQANHESYNYATKMHPAQIDDESTNPVGLEEEQHCNCHRLLVAFDLLFIYHKYYKLFHCVIQLNALYLWFTSFACDDF